MKNLLLVIFSLMVTGSAHAEWAHLARLSTLGMASVGWMNIETDEKDNIKTIGFSYGKERIDFAAFELRKVHPIVPSWAFIYATESTPRSMTLKVLFNKDINKTQYGSVEFLVRYNPRYGGYELVNTEGDVVQTINVNFKVDAPWHPLTPLGIKSMKSN